MRFFYLTTAKIIPPIANITKSGRSKYVKKAAISAITNKKAKILIRPIPNLNESQNKNKINKNESIVIPPFSL